MAIKKGRDGSCEIDGTAVSVKGWTYDPVFNTSDTSVVGTKYPSALTTTLAGSGSITLNFDPDNASQKVVLDMFLDTNTARDIWLVLFYDTTNLDGFSFSALVTGVSLPMDSQAVDELTINFVKNSATWQVPTT